MDNQETRMRDKGKDFGRELCQALGLNTSQVTGISIHSKAGDGGLVAEVRLVPTSVQEAKLVKVVEKYTLRVEHKLP